MIASIDACAPAFLGQEPISVVPTYNTADVFALLGIALDPGLVGCHEMVHYVHSLQTGGLGYTVSSILGPLYSPQMGLDPWFQEGLAVFYETKLQPGVGRLRSRYFEGILAAAAAEGDLDTGTPPPAVGSWCERRSGSRP